MKCIVSEDVVLSRPLEGPLSAHIAGFAKWAHDEGYALYSRQRQVLLAACFSRWLGQERVSPGRVTSGHVVQYLRSRARHLKICRGDAAALRQFIDFLLRQGVIPAERIQSRVQSPAEQVVQEFERYLLDDRALAPSTAVHCARFVRGFLASRFGRGPVKLSQLCAGDVVRFVQRQARRLHLKQAKFLTTALRSFLHYLRYRGEILHDLSGAVPTVANWSMTSIPRAIPPDLVRRLLASINRHTALGRRDCAVLLL
jgi:site-specific recombinase XerC